MKRVIYVVVVGIKVKIQEVEPRGNLVIKSCLTQVVRFEIRFIFSLSEPTATLFLSQSILCNSSLPVDQEGDEL